MDRSAEAPPALGSPRLARAIATMLCAPSERPALIGDLEEEYARLVAQSPARARTWYWRQTVLSAPRLIAARCRSAPAGRLAITLIAAGAAFFLLRYWDMFVARGAARGFFALFESGSYAPARAVYLAAYAGGFALAGAGIAFAAFDRRAGFTANLARRLLPAAVLLFAPAIIAQLTGSDHYDAGFRVLQIALAAGALVLGARCATALSSRRIGD